MSGTVKFEKTLTEKKPLKIECELDNWQLSIEEVVLENAPKKANGKTVSLIAEVEVEDFDKVSVDDKEIPMKRETKEIAKFVIGTDKKENPTCILLQEQEPTLKVEGPGTLHVIGNFITYAPEEEEEEEEEKKE